MATYKVFVDEGHGGTDPGAVDGTKNDKIYSEEKDYTLDIGLKLGAALQRCGVFVRHSRIGDTSLSLTARTNSANSWKADSLVSVHCNALKDGSPARGIEVFHYPGSVNGEKLAKAVYAELDDISPWPDRGVKTANFHMLRESAMEAILIEFGFITNTEEEAAMASPSYRLALAEATARGVCKYLGIAYHKAQPLPAQVYRLNVMWAEDMDAMKLLTDKARSLGLRYSADGPSFECHADTPKTLQLEALVAREKKLHRHNSTPNVPQNVYKLMGVYDGIGNTPWEVKVG